MRHTRSLILLAGLLAHLPTGPLAAQARWPTPLDGSGELSLRWDRPHFPEREYGFLSGILTFGARVRVSNNVNIAFEIPQFRAPGTGSDASMGNPYIGAEFVGDDGIPAFTAGLRVINGSTGGEPQIVALFTDYERFDQTITADLWVISGMGHWTAWTDGQGSTVRVRFGGTIFHPTEYGGTDELVADYGVRFGKALGRVELSAALTGRYFVTQQDLGPEAGSINSAAVELVTRQGRVRPSIGLRFPLDAEVRDDVPYVLLLGVRASLK
jgi:hypothetical protein